MSAELALVEAPTSLPAVRLDSWVTVIADVGRLAQHIAETEFVPRGLRGNPAAITAAILYGREVGLPPMQALRWVNVIDGRPALAAESMRALVLAAGHELVFVTSTSARCVCRGRRRGTTQWHEVEWTYDQAQKAGLTGGGPRSAWNRYPRSMLKARATSELCRDVFPDVTGGFAAVEELDVMPDDGATRPAETVEESTGVVARAGRRKTVRAAPETPREVPSPEQPPVGVEEEDSREVDPPPVPPVSPPAEVVEPVADTLEEGVEEAEPPVEIQPWDVPLPLDVPEDEPATDAQGRLVFRLLGTLGTTRREDRLEVARAVLLRRVESFGELTKSDATKLIDALAILAATEEETAGAGTSQLDAIVRLWRETEPMPPELPFEEG